MLLRAMIVLAVTICATSTAFAQALPQVSILAVETRYLAKPDNMIDCRINFKVAFMESRKRQKPYMNVGGYFSVIHAGGSFLIMLGFATNETGYPVIPVPLDISSASLSIGNQVFLPNKVNECEKKWYCADFYSPQSNSIEQRLKPGGNIILNYVEKDSNLSHQVAIPFDGVNETNKDAAQEYVNCVSQMEEGARKHEGKDDQ